MKNCAKKVWALMVAFAITACGCSKPEDFRDTTYVVMEDYACAEYLEGFANEHYYLDVSLFVDGMIIYNTIAMADGVIESRSNYGGSVSHTLSKDGKTYFIDDKHKVYFLSYAGVDDGLRSVINYSTAKFKGSGNEDIAIAENCFYEDFSCTTYDGTRCGVKFFTDADGALVAIVDYDDTSSVERDVAEFSRSIPDGWLKIPEDYTLVDEDTYFDMYYGK